MICADVQYNLRHFIRLRLIQFTSNFRHFEKWKTTILVLMLVR
jgi:hypothetical protein